MALDWMTVVAAGFVGIGLLGMWRRVIYLAGWGPSLGERKIGAKVESIAFDLFVSEPWNNQGPLPTRYLWTIKISYSYIVSGILYVNNTALGESISEEYCRRPMLYPNFIGSSIMIYYISWWPSISYIIPQVKEGMTLVRRPYMRSAIIMIIYGLIAFYGGSLIWEDFYHRPF